MNARGLCDCSIVVLRLEECQGTGVGHTLFRSTREKGTDASAMTPGQKYVESSGKTVWQRANL